MRSDKDDENFKEMEVEEGDEHSESKYGEPLSTQPSLEITKTMLNMTRKPYFFPM